MNCRFIILCLLCGIGCRQQNLSTINSQPDNAITITSEWEEFSCHGAGHDALPSVSFLIKTKIVDVFECFLKTNSNIDEVQITLKNSFFSYAGNDYQVDGKLHIKTIIPKNNIQVSENNRIFKEFTGLLIDNRNEQFKGFLNGHISFLKNNRIVCSEELHENAFFVCWSNPNNYNLSEYCQKVYDGKMDYFQVLMK